MGNTVQVERTVISALLQDATLRSKLIASYPGVTGEPSILFSCQEAMELLPSVLSQSGRYSSAMYASVMPITKPEWAYDKIRFEATNQDITDFNSHTETLRKNRKHELLLRSISELNKKYKESTPNDSDDFASVAADAFGKISLSNSTGGVPANADEIDDALERQLSEGQKFKVKTGVEALDYLTGGGLHISKNGGELVVVGGFPKNRKSTLLHNLVFRLLEHESSPKIVWVSTESAFTPTDIEVDFIAKIASDWMLKNTKQPFDFSHDDALIGRAKLGTAFSSKEKNDAMQYAVGKWRNWKDKLRVFGPGLREGNTLNFDGTMSMLQTEIEARGCEMIIIDRAQEWITAGQEIESMRRITRGISGLNARYQIPMFIVTEYNRGGDLSYGGALEYALSAWIECRYNSKETPDMFEIELKRGRYVGSTVEKQRILPKSGLLLNRIT